MMVRTAGDCAVLNAHDASVSEALTTAKRHAGPIHLLISGVVMPSPRVAKRLFASYGAS